MTQSEGRTEAIPACGIVDIISTSGLFAALTKKGEVRSWGVSRLCGHPHSRIPPMWNRFGPRMVLLLPCTKGVLWLTANSTMFIAGRANHVVVYWGFHTGILTPCFDPAGELRCSKDDANPYPKKEWRLFFFLRLPNGQYGPVSQLSRSEKCCTGPFNWSGAHCAGEKVKRKIE